jgi:hypothetical protein
LTELVMIHGEIRWLVGLAAVVALARFSIGWALKKDYSGLDRGLMAGFTGLLDLNLLLGLVLIVGLGGLTGPRIEHGVTMLLAAVAAHASAAWKRSDDSAKKYRNNIMVIVGALLLVVVAVVRLRGGWIFR